MNEPLVITGLPCPSWCTATGPQHGRFTSQSWAEYADDAERIHHRELGPDIELWCVERVTFRDGDLHDVPPTITRRYMVGEPGSMGGGICLSEGNTAAEALTAARARLTELRAAATALARIVPKIDGTTP